MGISLQELEKLNGKAFRLLGYGWDYSGTVSDWDGGKLQAHTGLLLRLGDIDDNSIPERLLGDKEFLSSDSTLQRLNPKVSAMIVNF